jgi:hypothetical protein
MSVIYDVPAASATWVEATGQVQYTATWNGGQDVTLSGFNLNDGTAWGPLPIDEPERFGPIASVQEFFVWTQKFVY